MRLAHRIRPFLPLLILSLPAIPEPCSAQVFDLADVIGSGDGTMPGKGTDYTYPINRTRLFLPDPLPYIDGVFVPEPNGLTQIDSLGTQFDFSPYVTSTGTNGTPANGLGTGTLQINDPSNLNSNPDYTGDSDYHSIMACHASVGITFDLRAIRAVFPGFVAFTANAGGSCGGRVGYLVLVDGQVAAQGGGLTWNSFNSVTVPIPASASFLTLASTDDNSGTINCAHMYWGDPFLRSACGGWVLKKGDGCADASGTVLGLDFRGDACVNGAFSLETTSGGGVPISIALGISDQSWGGVPLPFDLSPLGIPCTIYTSMDFFFPPIAPGSPLTVAVPNTPFFVGATSFFQSLVIDPNIPNPARLALSDLIAVTLGT